METLDGTEWDVVISGTGFVQSLLALSLSRSGKRILHLDRNDYYGGDEAAFSLSEAEAWAERHAYDYDGDRQHRFLNVPVHEPIGDWAERRGIALEDMTFSSACVKKPDVGGNASGSKLSSSRAYSLALAPQLLYSRSILIPWLVSSQSHSQLDFQAVGSWFVVQTLSPGSRSAMVGPLLMRCLTGARADPPNLQRRLTRVPSSREDVFQDKSLDLKAKRSLMKFLRFVSTYEEQTEVWQNRTAKPFGVFLEQNFGLPDASHEPILALTMSQEPWTGLNTGRALPKIARHLRSIGMFGPGFGAVLPKWGGLAEIAQVACRACAVGGGVYVLNKGIKSAERRDDRNYLELSGGEKVSSKWLVEGANITTQAPDGANTTVMTRGVFIISSSLSSLFPPTSEGGVTPAGAVVVVPPTADDKPPVHIFAHTSEAGECPMGQCVLYASVALTHESGFPILGDSVSVLLRSVGERSCPEVLWSMRYEQRVSDASLRLCDDDGGVIVLPMLAQDLALQGLESLDVKNAWQRITGRSLNGEHDDMFMAFEAREGIEDDD